MPVREWEAAALDPVQERPEPLGRSDAGACLSVLSSLDSLPAEHAETPELLSRASFDTDRLLYLASGGPDAGCRRLVVEDVTLENGTLSVEAHVACESGMAAQVVTYPAAVVWVPDVEADRATATVTDGWAQSHTVETDAG